jgi:hypothetical protein
MQAAQKYLNRQNRTVAILTPAQPPPAAPADPVKQKPDYEK